MLSLVNSVWRIHEAIRAPHCSGCVRDFDSRLGADTGYTGYEAADRKENHGHSEGDYGETGCKVWNHHHGWHHQKNSDCHSSCARRADTSER